MWRNISLRALDLSCFSIAAMILRCVAMDDALRLSVCNDSSRLRLNISINPETNFCSAWFCVARLMHKCNSASASTPVSPRLTAWVCLATIFFSFATSIAVARSATSSWKLNGPSTTSRCSELATASRFDQLAQLEDIRERLFFVDQQSRERSHQSFNRKVDDEIAHAGFADDESLTFQCAERLAHRSPADFEGLGQFALRRQLVAGLESTLLDQLVNLTENLLVDARLFYDFKHRVQLSAGQTSFLSSPDPVVNRRSGENVRSFEER